MGFCQGRPTPAGLSGDYTLYFFFHVSQGVGQKQPNFPSDFGSFSLSFSYSVRLHMYGLCGSPGRLPTNTMPFLVSGHPATIVRLGSQCEPEPGCLLRLIIAPGLHVKTELSDQNPVQVTSLYLFQSTGSPFKTAIRARADMAWR